MSKYRFGKHPPKQDYRTLRLRSYLKSSLDAPPESFNVLDQVFQKLGVDDPAKLFPMDANDSLSDCTIAGIGGEKILAFVSIDPRNHAHIQQAIQLFGGVYLGFQVQAGAQAQFDQGQPWTPAPLTQDGLAVHAVAYDQDGVTVLTWGNTQLGTWDWWDECVDEVYAILPPDAKKTDFSPGFDFTQLETDLQQVADQG